VLLKTFRKHTPLPISAPGTKAKNWLPSSEPLGDWG
jgi:hypothetical protein